MALNKDQILGSTDVHVETADVPEWGGQVCIRTMTGIERDDFEDRIARSDKASGENWRAKLLVKCICDDKGVRLFSDDESTKLGGKNAPVLARLFKVASRLNKLGREDIEAYEKNSVPVQNDGHTSA